MHTLAILSGGLLVAFMIAGLQHAFPAPLEQSLAAYHREPWRQSHRDARKIQERPKHQKLHLNAHGDIHPQQLEQKSAAEKWAMGNVAFDKVMSDNIKKHGAWGGQARAL